MIEMMGFIPFRIHPTFWILPLLIAWLNSGSVVEIVLWIVVILLSLTVHEFGHALTAYAFKQKPEISLYLLGGVTTRKGTPLPIWKDFLITLNGPLAGFALAGVAYLIYQANVFQPGTIPGAFFQMLFFVNLIWTIVNILPILPLDGGQLFSHVLEALFGVNGIRAAYLFSGIFGILFGMGFFFLRWFLAGMFFLIFGVENFREWGTVRTLTPADRDIDFRMRYQDAELELKEGDVQVAKELFQGLREETGEGVLFKMSSRNLAKIFYDQGREEEAYALLKECLPALEGEWIVFCHRLAGKHGDWEVVSQLSRSAYLESPSGDVALRNAFAFGALGDAKAAVGWLQSAAQEGDVSIASILREGVFDPIREQPLFSKYAEEILSRSQPP